MPLTVNVQGHSVLLLELGGEHVRVVLDEEQDVNALHGAEISHVLTAQDVALLLTDVSDQSADSLMVFGTEGVQRSRLVAQDVCVTDADPGEGRCDRVPVICIIKSPT